jgi:hypothetical protein
MSAPTAVAAGAPLPPPLRAAAAATATVDTRCSRCRHMARSFERGSGLEGDGFRSEPDWARAAAIEDAETRLPPPAETDDDDDAMDGGRAARMVLRGPKVLSSCVTFEWVLRM